MSKKRLNVKDLITIGLFTAIYFVVFFTAGMLGFIPITMILLPFIIALVGAIPLLLLVNKTQKFGAVSISGTIVVLLMFLTGHPWTVILFGVPLAILGDLIMLSGKYIKWGAIMCGYTVFSLWAVGAMMPFYYMKEAYLKSIEAGYGKVYSETLDKLFTVPMLFVIVGGSIIGSIIGCIIAKYVLKKHFKRAGIV